MKGILRLLIFILLALPAKAQWVEITNLAGTTAYGSLNATVTSGGSVTTWTSWCTTMYNPPSYTSYWAGEAAAGWYTFTLNHAVSGIKVYSYALNGGTPPASGEYLELYINGAPYSFTAADMTNYLDCPSSPTTPCYLYTLGSGTTVIMGPTGSTANYSGGDFVHTDCAGITSFELYCNGNEAGVTYYVFVDTVFACFNATANAPCVGSALDLTVTGGTSSIPYNWYGPGGFTSTVMDPVIDPATLADTGWYYVVQTIGGVNDTAKVHVTVNPIPIISGPTQVCQGTTITLTSSVTGTTWSSSSTTIATVGSSTGVVTGVSPGVVVIDGTAAGCPGTYTVTVNPNDPITGIASVCVGSTTLLSNAVPGGTWISSNTTNATIAASGLVSGLVAGTSTISYTTSSGCLSTKIVTVDPLDPITGTTTICAGGTSTLANAVTGGTWSSSNTAVATVALTTGVVTGVATGTCNITYVTPAGCVSTTTVNVFILTTISGNEPVCQGSTLNLVDGTGGGVWSSTNTGVATIGPSNGVVTGIGSGTTTISYSGSGGCYTTATVTVDPISPITGALGVCQYLTTALADALPGGTWSSSTPTVATINASGVVSALIAGTTTITYTSPAGCLMTVIVTVHPKPILPGVTPLTFCQNNDPTPAPIALTAATASGDVLSWYGLTVIPEGTSTGPIPSTSTPGITDYYVTQTSSFGCVSDSATLVVTVTLQPAPPTATPATYCQGSTTLPLNYQVDSVANSHLSWSSGESAGFPTGTIYSTTPIPSSSVTPTYPGGTTWYVTQTVDMCRSFTTPVTVTIVYQPKFNLNESSNWVCDHDTLSFWYTLTGATPLLEGSSLWQLPQGATIVNGSDTSNAITVKFDTVYGQHFVYLTVGELNNMCITTDTQQITVIALPTASSYMNPNICLGDTVSLALSSESASASIFSWYIDGAPLGSSGEINMVAANSNSGGPFSLSWNDTGSHIITVTTTTEQGCKSLPSYDTVDVHALPDATFIFKPKSNSTLCLEDSVQFIANYANDACSYLWQPAHGFNNDNKPVIWGKVEETQSDITLTVTDPFGCVGVSTQQLDPSACCTVMFPNAFTPNNDGKDDVFRPLFNGYHNFHSFRIVNRWGQTIFESANSLPAWDGTFNGVAQDIGTYYYYIQYDCGGNTVQAKGDVTLIR